MGYEEDREQNAVGFSWEFEPDAIERRNRIMRAQEERALQAKARWYAEQLQHKPSVDPQMLKTVGVALVVIAAIVFLLLLAPVGGCQELTDNTDNSGQTDSRPDNLPDSPTPHIAIKSAHIDSQAPLEPIQRPYWDRTNVILASSMVAVGSFDLAQTCHSIANGGREVWMPMKTCPQLVGVGIAMGLGMTYLSYQLHRHGHHRLERIPFIGMIAGNTAGITYSKEHGAW